eukprot:16733-Heterococcus_DN1.PRE.2
MQASALTAAAATAAVMIAASITSSFMHDEVLRTNLFPLLKSNVSTGSKQDTKCDAKLLQRDELAADTLWCNLRL